MTTATRYLAVTLFTLVMRDLDAGFSDSMASPMESESTEKSPAESENSDDQLTNDEVLVIKLALASICIALKV